MSMLRSNYVLLEDSINGKVEQKIRPNNHWRYINIYHQCYKVYSATEFVCYYFPNRGKGGRKGVERGSKGGRKGFKVSSA